MSKEDNGQESCKLSLLGLKVYGMEGQQARVSL
jgi:hypothetical protein